MRSPLQVVIILLAVVSSGCAEATIATAGAFVGVAASAVSTGADVYRMGKLDAVDMVDFSQQVEAVKDAARELKFTIEKEELFEPGRWRCMVADERKSHIRIHVERRTETVCRTRIDVGLLGSEPTARLLLYRVRRSNGADDPTTRIAERH